MAKRKKQAQNAQARTLGTIWPTDEAPNAHESVKDVLVERDDLRAQVQALEAALKGQQNAPKRTYTKADRMANLAKARQARSRNARLRREGKLPPLKAKSPNAARKAYTQATGKLPIAQATACVGVNENCQHIVGFTTFDGRSFDVRRAHAPAESGKSKAAYTVWLYSGQDVRGLGMTRIQAYEHVNKLAADGMTPMAWKRKAQNAVVRETRRATRKADRRGKAKPSNERTTAQRAFLALGKSLGLI